jgi:[amino-group carrier protein]-gamma-(L-lysyl/L-ornithyl)-L-glutamate aminotransferase
MMESEERKEQAKAEFSTEDEYIVPTYQKFPHKIVRGEGAIVFDERGREFVDLSGGYGVAIVGHANPIVSKAVSEQAARLITCHGSLYNDAREKYVQEITRVLPHGLGHLFLCNSGAEANEAAIKFARKATGRKEIVAFTGSYHGKTYGALSATWNQKYRKDFEPLLEGFKFAQFGKLDKARELVGASTAAIIVEPIQGESGIHIPPDDFLQGLRELSSSKGCLLITDEVQSGFGRTGRMWACENWNVTPDILTASKGVAGGVPFGFTAVSERVASILRPGDHTSTFGGNPLSCSAASAALRFLLESNILQKAASNGVYFKNLLEGLQRKHPSIIREVRGKGLMIGIELKVPVREVITRGFEHDLILLYSGLNVVRLLPPLVITRHQIDLVVERLSEIFASLEGTGPKPTESLTAS